MTRPSRRHRFVDLAAGGASVVALLAIVVAVPVGLVLTIGSPLPRAVPSPDVVAVALRYGQIAPSTLLRGLAMVLWVVWALLVLSLGLEIAAVVRGTVARAVPGLQGFQQMAARLIATVMLLSSVTTRAGAAAPPIPAVVAVQPPVSVGMPGLGKGVSGSADGRDTGRPAEQPAPSWTVRRHDSLWAIAERTLGDGHRWKEIAALNAERRQPDGRRLGRHSTLIHPGWRLVLPEDAAVDEPSERVVVAPGDDLWGLAERHLGDGERWTVLYAGNRGRRQPDGGRLHDPDLIRPGWTLRLPKRRRPDEDPHRGSDPDERNATRAEPDAGPPARNTIEPERHAAPGKRNAVSGERSRAPRHHDGGGRNGASTAQPPALPFSPETQPRPSEGTAPFAEGPGVLPMVAEEPDEHGTPPAADTRGDVVVVVGGALLAAGLVGVLTRRRRHWLRRRQLGEHPATIDPEAAELERWLRSMADHDLHHRVDRVLRVLADHFQTHGVAPDVTAVELGDDISLQLAAAVTPPPGVSASGDGRRWTLSAELEVASPPVAAERYVPTLVSCGRLPSGSLLQLNPLATAGLGVTGRHEQLQDVMTSWTTELAAGGAARGVDLVVVGPHHPLVERLERVSIVADAAAAAARLQRAATDVEVSCIVLCGGTNAHSELASLLRAADHPRAGVVVFGDEPLTTTVALDGERVVLQPDGMSLEAPTWLTPDDWHRFGDLLHPSGHRHGIEPATSPLLSVVGDELEPLDGPPPAQPLVGVLGPLEIAGRAPRLDDGAAQLLTYLAVHRTGGDPAALQQLVWPRQQPDVERLMSAIAAIEATFDGDDAVVVRTDDGRIELSDTVASDLGRCEELARGLDHRPPPTQARLMYRALDLVRGEPFATAGAWAHADSTALRAVGLIVDLAHRLAMHALTIGDLERASWALDRGLRAAPANELLYRDRMRVADACGDTAALDAAMRELRSLTEADGGWVTTETERCYRHLRGIGDAPLDVEQDAS